MYNLKEIRSFDGLIDYDIIFNGIKIGRLDIHEYDNKVFIRHIDISECYRRCGHARNIIDYMFKLFNKNISFCIATNSESAVCFWEKILSETNNIHIRGNIYELIL